MEEQPERAREVFQAGLELVAERGIAGASLRRLAARLGLSQPSLYHYFKSKDELIDHLAVYGAQHMVRSMDMARLPTIPLCQIPHVVKDAIIELYRGERHVTYVKFLFVVAIESPRHREVIRHVFEEHLLRETGSEMDPFMQMHPQLAHDLAQALFFLARGVGLALMEDRIMFGLDEPSERTKMHCDFIARMTAQFLDSLQVPQP